jgi:hypothetical protein
VCKESLFREAAKRRLDALIHSSRAAVASNAGAAAAYDRLLLEVRSRGGMLARRSRCSEGVDVNKALLAMALHHSDWLAPVQTWIPSGASAWRELASLAEHLFARFPMARFMTSAWLAGEPGRPAPEQRWYKQLGLGHSLRRIGLPMRVTRAIAHRFSQAPDHLTVVAAIRWAQVLALGGSDSLASAVLATRLGRHLENESLWETAIQFFVNHPELELSQIGPIVDFLQHQKLEWREGVSSDGEFGLQPPPQPHLTLKGRTPASVLRLVAAWHEDLGTGHLVERRWPRSRIGELRWIERVTTMSPGGQPCTEARLWTISELCSSSALVLEGRAMQHCVAAYVPACLHGQTTIWSLQLETRRGRRRVLTIELDPSTRSVRQARRKCNRLPSEAERGVVQRWAAQESLALPQSIQ